MHINKINTLLCLACLFVLIAPATAFSVPVPSLQSHTQAAWKNAWEDAWKIAWESAWKSVYTASAPAEAVQSEDAGMWNTSPGFEGEIADLNLNVVWGAPLENGLNSSDALALALAAENAVQSEYGKLYIQVTPADAEIVLRGQNTPFSQGMPLEPGTYIVDIRQSGYLVQTRRIDLLSGMAATLDVSLTPDVSAGAETSAATAPQVEAATQTQLIKNLLAPVSVANAQDTAEPAVLSDETADVVTDGVNDVVADEVADDVAESAPAEQEPGALYVSTEPADAKVRILQIKPVYHHGIQLAPGRYTIDAASQGFERSVAKVEINPNKDTRIHLALKQALPKAKLFVQTEPAAATVRILNIKPVFHQGIELKQGEYLLDAQLDGFKTITQKVLLAPGEEKNITLNLPEPPPTGRLYVDAVPAETRIRILDIRPKFEQGMQLEEGEYTIDAQLNGYQTEIRKVRIRPDEDTRISLQLAQAEETGRLFVETEPAGATVRVLDIRPRFAQGMELVQGEYTIDAQLDGYRTEIQKVSVLPGKDNKIRLNLAKAPEKGKLFVTTEPSGARVRILHIKPVFHQGIELVPGSYTIDAQLDGHATAVQKITIAPSRETHIALTLAQTLPADTEPVTAEPSLKTLSSMQQQPAETEPVVSALPQKDVAGYDIEAFMSMAVLAINSGNYKDAINASNHALALDAASAEALKIKGDAYLLLEEYDNAIAEYDKAIRLSDNQQLRVNRAYAFEQLEKEIKLLKAAKNVKHNKGKVHHQFALDN